MPSSDPNTSHRSERPLGVTLIGILYFLGSGLLVLLAVVGGAYMPPSISDPLYGHAMYWALVALLLIFAVLLFLLARAIMAGSPTARPIVVFLSCTDVLFSVFAGDPSAFGVALKVWIAGYLVFSDAATDYFDA